MKIFLASSVTLRASSAALADRLEAAGHEVCLPCNPEGRTELEIHQANSALIGLCDLVFADWDGMSDGCYGDVCMAIALGKAVYVQYPQWGSVDRRTLKPSMRRAWALFGAEPGIDEFLEKAPAATHGGDSGK